MDKESARSYLSNTLHKETEQSLGRVYVGPDCIVNTRNIIDKQQEGTIDLNIPGDDQLASIFDDILTQPLAHPYIINNPGEKLNLSIRSRLALMGLHMVNFRNIFYQLVDQYEARPTRASYDIKADFFNLSERPIVFPEGKGIARIFGLASGQRLQGEELVQSLIEDKVALGDGWTDYKQEWAFADASHNIVDEEELRQDVRQVTHLAIRNPRKYVITESDQPFDILQYPSFWQAREALIAQGVWHPINGGDPELFSIGQIKNLKLDTGYFMILEERARIGSVWAVQTLSHLLDDACDRTVYTEIVTNTSKSSNIRAQDHTNDSWVFGKIWRSG
jgi:hypothetical protein